MAGTISLACSNTPLHHHHPDLAPCTTHFAHTKISGGEIMTSVGQMSFLMRCAEATGRAIIPPVRCAQLSGRLLRLRLRRAGCPRLHMWDYLGCAALVDQVSNLSLPETEAQARLHSPVCSAFRPAQLNGAFVGRCGTL